MFKTKNILLLVAVFLISVVATVTALNWERINSNFESSSTTRDESEDQAETEPEPFAERVPESEFVETGWIPDWGSREGQRSFEAKHRRFDSISPVWYEIKEDGSLVKKIPANAAATQRTARERGILMLPAIAMFDHELFSKVLQSPENLQRHVESIVTEVEDQNYDGIDLDYESTKLEDKEKYFEFLGKLSSELKSRDKHLVVTVIAQWENNTGYKSFRETRQVQDWTEIAKYADQIRIMTYDYTSFKAISPGPIAPLSWQRQVLEYAVKRVPREKLYLGIHLYSYEWWMPANEYDKKVSENPGSDPLAFSPNSDFNLPISDRSARSYTYTTVKDLVTNFEGELGEHEGEKYFKYRKDNPQTGATEQRVLVYIDPDGVNARINLAKEFGIKGVAYWRLGNEGDLL